MEILNRKARFNYQIEGSFEVGLVLEGPEVKSIRNGQMSLDESFARIKNGEAWLEGAHIAPYLQARTEEVLSPLRSRKLLIKKEEIEKLALKLKTDNLTLVPLKVYLTRNRIKLELGIARGKKKFDKRESIKNREAELEGKRATRTKR